MNKLSNEKIAQVLHDAKRALLSITEERDKLAAENAELKTQAEAEKLAAEMHGKGLRTDTDREELVEELKVASAQGRIDTIREAVGMMAPDMSFNGTLAHDAPGNGANALENYILGNVG